MVVLTPSFTVASSNQRGDGLRLRIEFHDLLAVRPQIAQFGTARTREAEGRHDGLIERIGFEHAQHRPKISVL